MRIQRKREKESSSIQSDTLQRSTTTPEQTMDGILPIVQEALSSNGQPLDASTREFMESRFGHDFSQVRVHTDEQAVESAQAVNAQAYTVGSDIVFDRGQYAPAIQTGQHLLAHELTHVVQQAGTLSSRTLAHDELSLSHPFDSLEVAANSIADRVMGASSIGAVRGIPSHGSSGRLVVQRFQAGEKGHGKIEENALTAAGFTFAEARKVYFGNWLRDFSQGATGLPLSKQSLLQNAAFYLFQILALGEFGRLITPEDLGSYVASEHLDNPIGGGSVEDPSLTDPKKAQEQYENLSPDQKAAYEQEQAHIAEIQAAAKASGLPEYIEVGKFHARQKLTEALNAGKTDAGMQAMGNGLHAIEDYFSHANFVEVAIWELFHGRELTQAEYEAWVPPDPHGPDLAHLGGSDMLDSSQPAIITGSYGTGWDKVVSMIEQLCTEVETGELRDSFAKGFLIQTGVDLNELGKRLELTADQINQIAIQPYYQGVSMLVDMVGLPKILAAYPGISTAMHSIIAGLKVALSAENLTKMATKQAEKKAGKKGLGPTHSKIAKDSPDHPLYPIAMQLAESADKEIGEKMLDAWTKKAALDASAAASTMAPAELVDEVTSLVDKFVSHPSRDRWWYRTVFDAVKP